MGADAKFDRDGASPPGEVLRYDGGGFTPCAHRPVEERPFALNVNGVPLATLIASSHDPQYLVVGFLRMQGLVSSLDDILALSVCPDFGVATVRIRGAVPESLRPVVTTGCGGGVTFHLPSAGKAGEARPAEGGTSARLVHPEEIFRLMERLGSLASQYRERGGVHSAAAGDGREILVHAEDIGRHNAVDRLAGEALFKGIDFRGLLMATSGRISSEMALKGADLGVSLIASRTTPTDLAVRICEERGVTLVGYVRGRRFNVYSHPWRIVPAAGGGRIAGVTGAILAGGTSRRMGCDKALLPYHGGRFLEAIYRRMAELFDEVLLVTNAPEAYGFLPCRKVPDLFPGQGSLAGIHSALVHGASEHVFVVACDMPTIHPGLVRYMASLRAGHDIVVPEGEKGAEPLHACYGKGALPAIEKALRDGCRRVVSFYDGVRVRRLPAQEVARLDPAFTSFRNVNTPEDYYALREEDRA